jgi:hypothetical protein
LERFPIRAAANLLPKAYVCTPHDPAGGGGRADRYGFLRADHHRHAQSLGPRRRRPAGRSRPGHHRTIAPADRERQPIRHRARLRQRQLRGLRREPRSARRARPVRPSPELVQPIVPSDGCDFLQKIRHSAFYSTSLEYLLHRREVTQLILTGQVTEQCILYSALDAMCATYGGRASKSPSDGVRVFARVALNTTGCLTDRCIPIGASGESGSCGAWPSGHSVGPAGHRRTRGGTGSRIFREPVRLASAGREQPSKRRQLGAHREHWLYTRNIRRVEPFPATGPSLAGHRRTRRGRGGRGGRSWAAYAWDPGVVPDWQSSG